MTNMAFEILVDITVVVHTKHPPNDDEWEAYLTSHAPFFDRGMGWRFAIFTDGGAPTAVQRMKMNEMVADWMRRNPDCIRSAIITKSAFVRGVVTAIGWFRPIARAFSPDNLDQALAYLDVPASRLSEIQTLVPKLKAKLTPDGSR